MNSFQFIFQYIKKHKWQYIGGIITLFVVDYANVYIPQTTGMITDGLVDHSLDWNGIFKLLMVILGLGATLAIGRFFWRFFLFGAARQIEKQLRDDMFAHLETMDVEYFNQNKTGDLMTRFTSDLNAIRMTIGMGVIAAFDATIMLIMVLFKMMHYVNVKLTLLVMIPMLLILFGELYYGKLIHQKFLKRQEAVSDLTDFVQESFSGVRVLKAFVRERSEMREFAKYNQKTMEKNLTIAKMQSVVIPLLDVVIGLSSLITLVYGGWLALHGEITVGQFIAFNQYIGMLVWPMLACGESINTFSQGAASIKRVQEIMDTVPKIKDTKGLSSVKDLSGDIVFSDLTFTHNDQNIPTIQHFNLNVTAGTTLAIIGRTGNGKSTLVNLLLHLYEVERGMISFDGIDINDIPLKDLRRNIGYVPQDNFLFSDTLARNIAFGVDHVDLEEIVNATNQACIHDNIMDFPDQYETLVGERGVTLSGGQKQRSSIARAFMKDAPILILDDALSAVDTNTERQILTNLKQLRKNKTTILIAHRITTIQNADVIVVLEDGIAKEMGNHNSLMAQKGIYFDLFEKQQLEAKKKEEL